MMKRICTRLWRRAGLLAAVVVVASAATAVTGTATAHFTATANPGPLIACVVPDAEVVYQATDSLCAEPDHDLYDVATAVEAVVVPVTIESGDYQAFAPCPSGKWPIAGGYEGFHSDAGPPTISGFRPEDIGGGIVGWMVEGAMPFAFDDQTGEPFSISITVEVVAFCAYLGNGLILPQP